MSNRYAHVIAHVYKGRLEQLTSRDHCVETTICHCVNIQSLSNSNIRTNYIAMCHI
jgi:hypothetical protein